MSRVSQAELNGAFERYTRALEGSGVNGGVKLVAGSKVNGRAFRVYDRNGYAALGTVDGYLGMTKTEAVDTLRTIARTLEGLAHHRSEL